MHDEDGDEDEDRGKGSDEREKSKRGTNLYVLAWRIKLNIKLIIMFSFLPEEGCLCPTFDAD
jgi:hypothetical protein